MQYPQLAMVCKRARVPDFRAHRRSIQRLGSGAGQFLNQPSAAFDVGTLLAVAVEVLEVRVHPGVIAELVSVVQRSHTYLAMLVQVTPITKKVARAPASLSASSTIGVPADRGRRRT